MNNVNKPVRIVFGETLKKLANEYDFIACNADTKCCSFEDFGLEYPEREVSIGIAEQNMMGVACGLASCGNKVILSTYSNFAILRACEQVRTYICNPNLDIMILGTHAGLQTGCEGVSHTAIEDIAIARAIPNMTIIQPSDNISAMALAKEAMNFKGPLYVRLPYDSVDDVHSNDYHPAIGKIETVIQYGYDVALFATGIMLGRTLKAAEILRSVFGISVTVLEVHTIKPIDREQVINIAKRCRCVVTVEDHSRIGGLGSCIAEILSEVLPVYMKMIGINDCFIKSGDAELLYKDNNMLIKDIVQAAVNVYSISHK